MTMIKNRMPLSPRLNIEETNRPLSPHLYLYKAQLTSFVSIFHRISGSILSLSFIVLAFVFYLDVLFSEHYILYCLGLVLETYGYWFFISLSYLLLTFFCLHVFNGMRHLIWDLGLGLDVKNVYITGSVVLTSTSLILILLLL
ncbi:succinate:cytochrome c oxidoreductase subunit 4 (mitochondrion) [Hemiselmis andersenii]|uniref:Succinate:cytochrome c oxidoreductase subunit 4 n=1 Tax=Hemiselmis andersenii TaxID=464988 RepID=B2MWS6_HEMAN|nr:succinate:cytochrome c oxidoreductase subunit 4 [Hemiselmis andersenii]ACC78218.1 succinate:cytochrome c oxidoreductase subunit 4 [Hemiselmis andersenii]